MDEAEIWYRRAMRDREEIDALQLRVSELEAALRGIVDMGVQCFEFSSSNSAHCAYGDCAELAEAALNPRKAVPA